VAAALTAAVAYAVYVLMAEHAVSWRDPASLSAYGFLFAALFWAAVQPVWRFPVGRLDDSVRCSGTSNGTRCRSGCSCSTSSSPER
jgi:hypothetical protein